RVRTVAAGTALVFFGILRFTGLLHFPFGLFALSPLALIFLNQPWPWIVKKIKNDALVFFINQSFDIFFITWGVHFLGGTNFSPLILAYSLIFIFTGTVL